MNDVVNILSNYQTALKFKALSDFEIDLGKKNLKQQGPNSTILSISEKFVEHVYTNYGFLINKIGKFGKISFYYSSNCSKNKIYIFLNEKENEIDVPDYFEKGIENWFSQILYDLKNNLENAIG